MPTTTTKTLDMIEEIQAKITFLTNPKTSWRAREKISTTLKNTSVCNPQELYESCQYLCKQLLTVSDFIQKYSTYKNQWDYQKKYLLYSDILTRLLANKNLDIKTAALIVSEITPLDPHNYKLTPLCRRRAYFINRMLKNKSLSALALPKLISVSKDDKDLLCAIAKRADLTPDLMESIMQSSHWQARVALANNKNFHNREILDKLALDESGDVRRYISRRPDTPIETLAKMYLIAKSPSRTKEVVGRKLEESTVGKNMLVTTKFMKLGALGQDKKKAACFKRMARKSIAKKITALS